METVKISLVIIAFIVSVIKVWVLPESQRERCIRNVHSWHIERIHKIDKLVVDGKIKSEMIKFSYIKEAEQLEQVCGVSDVRLSEKR